MDPRYPVGKFVMESDVTPAKREAAIAEIDATPAKLRAAVSGLDDTQLDTPYREGGWTIRQVAHHVPDSHLNAYIRLKLALTETEPTIKPYEEQHWAELADSKTMPIAVSLDLLDALHKRWMVVVRSMKDTDFARTFVHPAFPKPMTLDTILFMYAWHGRHHVAHVTEVRKRKGW